MAISILLCSVVLGQGSVRVSHQKVDMSKPGKYSVTAQVPQFSGGATSALANVVLLREARAQMGAWLKDVKELERDAVPTDPERFAFDSTGTVTIARTNLISVVTTVYSATGGAHPNTFYVSRNFGLLKGKVKQLKLRDLFLFDPRAQINRLVMKRLKATGRAAWLESGEVKKLNTEQFEKFSISPKGLTFTFDPYEMGPYAAGSFQIDVGFNEVNGWDRRGPLAALLK